MCVCGCVDVHLSTYALCLAISNAPDDFENVPLGQDFMKTIVKQYEFLHKSVAQASRDLDQPVSHSNKYDVECAGGFLSEHVCNVCSVRRELHRIIQDGNTVSGHVSHDCPFQ